jgi:hypothetical protein
MKAYWGSGDIAPRILDLAVDGSEYLSPTFIWKLT